MPLSIGDKLGPYEILALVGKGRIGERFACKARSIAALNPTDICR
jgi:hypothetical protein